VNSPSASFRVRDVPAEHTIIQHIKLNSNFEVETERHPCPPFEGLVRMRLPPELFAQLREAALAALESFGSFGWLSSEGRDAEDNYRSLSLTYNPDLHDPGINDVHQSTLGTSINSSREFFYNSTQKFKTLKHTYFDTYGFRKPTPAARTGALGRFLSQCGLNLVRSRLSVIHGEQGETVDFMTGWHRDERVFENLRVNIPLTSDEAYRMQVEPSLEKPDPASTSMREYHLAPGYAYSLNTNLPHRVYARSRTNVPRVHLVLGFSPWLRYDEVEDAWSPNAYYGKINPLAMLRKGLLHPELEFDGYAS
jgi:hypothetical protein